MIKKSKRTISVEIRQCDFCENESDILKICYGCNKDICRTHSNYFEYDWRTGDYEGDYPHRFCPDCYNIARCLKPNADEINAKRDEELENLKQAFFKLCGGVK